MKKKYTKEQLESLLIETIEETVSYFKEKRVETLKQIEDEEAKKGSYLIMKELEDVMTIGKYVDDVMKKL